MDYIKNDKRHCGNFHILFAYIIAATRSLYKALELIKLYFVDYIYSVSIYVVMIIFFAENIMRLVESIILILSRKVLFAIIVIIAVMFISVYLICFYILIWLILYIYMRVIVCSSYYKRNISQGREKKNVLHQWSK